MSSRPNDWKKCDCEEVSKAAYPNDPTKWKTFNDTDGNGQCNNTVKSPNGGSMWCNGWPTEPDNSVNINPYISTKTVTVINKDPSKPLLVVWPLTPQFHDLDVTVDGVLIIEDGVEIKKK